MKRYLILFLVQRMKEKIFGSKEKGAPNDQNPDNKTSEQVQQDPDNRTPEQVQQDVGKAVAGAVKKRNEEKEAAKAKAEDQKKKDEGVVYAGTNPSDNSDESKDISSNLTDEERKKKEEEKAKEQREAIWAGTSAKPKKSRESYGMLSDVEIDEYDRLNAKRYSRSLSKNERKRLKELDKKKKQKAVQI